VEPLLKVVALVESLLRVEVLWTESLPWMGDAGGDSGEDESLGVRVIVDGGRAMKRSSMSIPISSSSKTLISSTGNIVGTSFAGVLSFGKSSNGR